MTVGILAVGSMGISWIPGKDPLSSRSTEGAFSSGDAVASGTVGTLRVQNSCAPAPASSRVVNVRDAAFGAKGDGLADDTAALQRAVDAVAGTGGTVLIPDGTYLVNAVAQDGMGIRLKSHMTMRLSSGAVLKALPNASGKYAILAVSHASHVNIVGGTLQGERNAHTGTGGEWGMGLAIRSSQHVVVEGVTAKDCWGDGFYISDSSSDVTLCHVVADHNRRQGLSITSVDGMVVRNSIFRNTTGTQPEAGIDIEPNRGQTVANLLITGNTCTNNAGGGLQSGPPVAFAGQAFLLNVVIDGNTFSGNGLNSVDGSIRDGVMVANCDGVKVTNNLIANNLGRGILLRDNARQTLLRGNTVTGTLPVAGQPTWSGGGIYLLACAYSVVTRNTVTGNTGYGIWQPVADDSVTFTANTVSGNGRKP